MTEKHSRAVAGGRAVWLTERLWQLARDLPVESISITQVEELDQVCWFGAEDPPTCRAVALHAQRIQSADLNFPILLSADGRLMDGGHRLAKAWLAGHDTVQAKRFAVDPEPDYVVADTTSI